MSHDRLIASLRAAVEAAPTDVGLRVHLAELLLADGLIEDAVREAGSALAADPHDAEAMQLMFRAHAAKSGRHEGTSAPAYGNRDQAQDDDILRNLDNELTDIAPPPFVHENDSLVNDRRPTVRLADVGGMRTVKARLDAALFAPLRNPELSRLYRKSLNGGLLLYGPPGCGKTFLARAVAGEFGARFISVTLADVLDMYIGQSERNIADLFAFARRNTPSVMFFDEVDAIGQKRSQRRDSAARGSVNQLLAELDGVRTDNEGLYVIAATNHPWDVDSALTRPGRFDRMVFVGPPDREAREQILRYHLTDRPVSGIDAGALAKRSEGYSGADLAQVCTVAAERALMDSASKGVNRLIDMRDLTAALSDVRPSLGPWYDTARNVVQFANQSGAYDELAEHMRNNRLL